MGSIYHDIGGSASVDAAVEDFYRRVLADPMLAPYFEDVDTIPGATDALQLVA